MFLRKNEFQKTSYSQCGEDLIVKFIFDAIGNPAPSYMDIGAHHPFYLSNTALFYEKGSSGVNVEPDPALYAEFKKYRKRDVNLNVGVSNQESELDFYIISSPTLNTFSKEEAEKYAKEGDYKIKKVQKIKVLPLKAIIEKYCKSKFPDFLTVDAEGVDEIIIKEIDYDKNFPIVICIETISFSTSGRGEKNKFIIDYLTNKGYIAYADTNINTIFVRKDIWER